jgi:hypothetical protein
MTQAEPSPSSNDARVILNNVFNALGCSHDAPIQSSINGRLAGWAAAGSNGCTGVAVFAYTSDDDAQAVFNDYKMRPLCPDNNGMSYYKIANAMISLTPVGTLTAAQKSANYDINTINRRLSELKPSDSFRTTC